MAPSSGHVMRRARHILSLLSLGGVLAVGIAVPAHAASGPADGRRVLGAGRHVDALYPVVEDGGLEVRSLTADGEADPEQLVLHIPDTASSRIALPEEYGFLGEPGSDAWLSSQTQDPSVVWPGWSFEGISGGVLKGTVAIDLEGFSYAGEASSPTFAVTRPGGFGSKKVSQLIVPGSAFTGVSGEVGAHTHANWVFTDQGTYDIDFRVHATLADGKAVEDSATVRFVVGPVPDAQKAPAPRKIRHYSESADGLVLTPDKVDAEYFVGQTVNVTAAWKAAGEDAGYRWFLKKKGEPRFTEVPEQDSSTYTAKPDRVLDGAQLYAELVQDGETVKTSEPTTLHVQAHEPTTRLTVSADHPEYRVGDTARFTSKQAPRTDDEHYHWYLKRQGETAYAWIEESRLADQELPVTAGLHGAQIVARLFDADHAVLAESAPLTLSVKGRSGDAPAVTATVEQDAEEHAAGRRAVFTAQVDGADGDHSVSWYVRKSAENPFTRIEGAQGRTMERAVPADWDGAQIMASVTGGDGQVLAEGTVPVVKVTPAGKPSAAAEDEAASSGATVWWIAGSAAALLAVLAAAVLVRRRGRSDGVPATGDEQG
ncbi:choice-of-anchor M domain-containing protein [Streptomyces sp. NRRL WC-3549]|uniref:choice-of-anchor M domain-containing protein n=1 Tax=Streptomyces sp. NRRL WC-3549 TaxID=1463925 RepID=UPI000A6B02A1|nr:choice-of-anchor M domain-containing protein [Streptomyces sp. NRRL WC-3549]